MWLDKMMRKYDQLFTVLVSILLLSSCTSMTSWLQDDIYVAPPAELVEFKAEFQPQTAWTIDTGDGAGNEYADLAVWLQSDMIVTVDNEGLVSSYHSQSGKRVWSNELDLLISSGVGGGDGLVIIGSEEGDVIALDEVSGKLIWKNKVTSEILSPPKVGAGVAVVRTADGRTTGLSATDGQILWSYQRKVPLLSLRGASEAVLADDRVITGYANGKLVALALNDGSVIWEKSVAVPRGRSELDRIVDIDSAPVIKDGIVYVVAYHGRLAALSLDNGEVLWYREASSRSGIDVDAGNAVYLSDDEDYVWALQDGSGDALWRQTELLRRKITAPLIVGNYLVVGDYDGYVHWISREDGHFVARMKVAGDAIVSKPVMKDNLVYITSTDGDLTAIKVQ